MKRKDGGEELVTYTARHLTLRELFHDWEREDPLELAISPLDDDDVPPAALDAARAAAQLRRMAAIVEHQMRFWNEFYAVVLETHADMNGDGKRFMPRNDFNAPNAATLATGGGQSTNVYAGGVYELGPDEALVIEARVPVAPLYQGFHLANLWGESLDFANHQSSLNAFQIRARCRRRLPLRRRAPRPRRRQLARHDGRAGRVHDVSLDVRGGAGRNADGRVVKMPVADVRRQLSPSGRASRAGARARRDPPPPGPRAAALSAVLRARPLRARIRPPSPVA